MRSAADRKKVEDTKNEVAAAEQVILEILILVRQIYLKYILMIDFV